MSTSNTWQPPEVWNPPQGDTGGKFTAVNQPTAGARFERELPRGKHPFQLYSLATPNGQKAGIMFEELLAAGVREAEYDAWLIQIMDLDQFGSGFVAVNPNSKIPALLDCSTARPVRVFESGAILLYLADKFHRFIPADHAGRTEVLNWLFWLQGSAPYIGGGFGHFYAYATVKQEYPINRFTMETKRLLDVLDQRLAETRFVGGNDYSIADIACWPWIGGLMNNVNYRAAKFLDVETYRNVRRWTDEVGAREPVRRGRLVNGTGTDRPGVPERHSAADIDKVLAARQGN